MGINSDTRLDTQVWTCTYYIGMFLNEGGLKFTLSKIVSQFFCCHHNVKNFQKNFKKTFVVINCIPFLFSYLFSLISWTILSTKPTTQCFFKLKFIFSNLWARWVGHQPQEDLAKFGYKLERKVLKNLGFLLHIWHHIGTYCLNMATFRTFSLIMWWLRSLFSSQKKLNWIIHASYYFCCQDEIHILWNN